ncbi:MAG: cytochrome c oxidase subunit 2A [Acidimicrobiia bacterium]|nr:cytochrome c oxidase subunit 2A [Acidimicrobiia bacterium]
MADDTDIDEPEERHPRGTLLITSLFLVGLVVVWVAMYYMMLSRS